MRLRTSIIIVLESEALLKITSVFNFTTGNVPRMDN